MTRRGFTPPSWTRHAGPIRRERKSDVYVDPAVFLRAWTPELGPRPPSAVPMTNPGDVAGARRFLHARAVDAGFDQDQAMDICLAASELLTNAIVHGGGNVTLWTGDDEETFVCQIEDHGHGIGDPLAGYRPPPPAGEGGRGLWLTRQIVDLVEIVPTPSGTAVRFQVRAPEARVGA
jgi:anti-sigma regulatory factor (Ser/Thr protein kinase)